MHNYFKEKGISPVIGVILLVAVTVALVALATVIVFNIGSSVSEPSARSTVNVDKTNNGLQVQVIRNDNIEEMRVTYPNGSVDTIDSNVGDSILIPMENSGKYSITSVTSSGSENVLRTVSVSDDETTSTTNNAQLTGVVSINPVIPDAIVEAYNADNDVIKSTTTNTNGEYSLSVSSTNVDRLVVSSSGAVTYNGEPVYAGAEINTVDSDTVNFNFDETKITTGVNVNSSSVTIANTLEGKPTPSTITVANAHQLQAINSDVNLTYKIIRDINADKTKEWNDGKGFKPLNAKVGTSFGSPDIEFTGELNGNNHNITGLYINRTTNAVGLIGYNKGVVEKINVVNSTISGNEQIGGVVGLNANEIIKSSARNVTISGTENVGGLSGESNYNGEIEQSFATGNITGKTKYVGGLVGFQQGFINNSYTNVRLQGDSIVGGIAGWHDGFYSGYINNSYSISTINSSSESGGLVGRNQRSANGYYYPQKNSYWNTNISNPNSKIGTEITQNKIKGDLAKTNMNFNFTDTWVTVEDNYPKLHWQK